MRGDSLIDGALPFIRSHDYPMGNVLKKGGDGNANNLSF